MEYEERMRRIEEKHQAIAESLELLTADVHELQGVVKQQNEGIANLLRIAEIQHARITRLEDGTS